MISQLAFALTLAAALVSAQGPGGAPAAPAGCTSKSFVIPSWVVSNFSAAGDKISFTTYNRASNVTSTVECAGAQCTSSGRLQASVELRQTAAVVSLNETWNCNDRPGGEKFMFWGIGNNTVPLSGTDGKYAAKNPQVLVKASLVGPVEITPIYFEGPTGHDAPGCRTNSKTPKWTISALAYTDVNGDGIDAISQRTLSFLLINPATGYDASCMAAANPDGTDPSEGDVLTLNCAGLEFQSPTIGRYSTATQANFNPLTGQLSVSQTWYCDDEDPGRPLSISATGASKLPLACTTTDLPGKGNIKKYCELNSDYSLQGTVSSEAALTPFSIQDPTPGVDGCTISSLFSPRWVFSAFTLEGKAPAGAAAVTVPTGDVKVGFDVILDTQNRRYQYPMPIMQGKLADGSWHECEVGSDGGNGLPLWPYKCRFKYDAATKELTLDANWECRDLDVKHPILFGGVATTTIKSEIACEAVEGTAMCGTQDPSFTWTADISSVTWTAGKPVPDTGGLQGRK